MSPLILVNPKSFNVIPSYLPYGLLYIAGYLRSKNINTKIYDANTMTEDFLTFIKNGKPAIVGISILSGPCLSDAMAKAKLMRKYFPKIKIVFGNIHTTIFPKDVLKQSCVDYIIMNEGEKPLLELCQYILFNKGKLKDIKNLGYKIGKRLILNKIRPFIDLDELPLPAWDLLPIEKYIHNKFYCDRVIELNTSRGCPWNCSFCYNRLFNFRRWRSISPEKIIEQIEYLMENYKIKGFQFHDDEFDVDPERVKRFCYLLMEKKIKIKWAHNSRVNVADKERYALEKRAGCEFIEFGVESGSPRILKMINKQQTIKDIKRAFKICHQLGLKAGALFMIGLPSETKKEIKMTIKLIDSLKAQQVINTIYCPYPGSDLLDYYLHNHLIEVPKSLEEQSLFFDTGKVNINFSEVDSDYLQNLHARYFLNNIIQELKFCIIHKNFKLLYSHLKNRLNFQTLLLPFKGLKNLDK